MSSTKREGEKKRERERERGSAIIIAGGSEAVVPLHAGAMVGAARGAFLHDGSAEKRRGIMELAAASSLASDERCP